MLCAFKELIICMPLSGSRADIDAAKQRGGWRIGTGVAHITTPFFGCCPPALAGLHYVPRYYEILLFLPSYLPNFVVNTLLAFSTTNKLFISK